MLYATIKKSTIEWFLGGYMKRRWRWMLLLCLILMIPAQASANSPPPAAEYDYSLQIVNAPTEDFCVMLLTRDPGATRDALLNGVRADHINMVQALFSLEVEGWHPVFEVPESGLIQAAGTNFIEWKIVTQSLSEYRVLCVTESGVVRVTDPVVRRDYANRARYNASTNQLTQEIDYGDYSNRVLLAVTVTLIVELLLLRVYGFVTVKNLRVAILTNLCTQAFLNIILFVTHYFEFYNNDITLLLILEVLIPAVEAFVYAKLFEGKTIKKRVAYAIVANLSSFGVGILIYSPMTFLLCIYWIPQILILFITSLFN